MTGDLDSLRQQLGDALWQTRLADARERAAVVKLVLEAVEAGSTLTAAARALAPRSGVQTVRRWVEAWQSDGLDGLVDRRTGPSKTVEAEPDPQLSLGGLLGATVERLQRGGRGDNGPRAGLVKWSGSKQALVDKLLAMAPPRFERYHEPFVGGGSLFFALRPRAAFLSDLNAELINLYVVVRDDPGRLLEALARHTNTREHFLEVRGLHPDTLPPVERAARTLYLNRTCFNGIYRVNSKGLFNVPYGNMAAGAFYVPDAIQRAHRDLAGAVIHGEDFEQSGERAQAGDFVYFDPPYPRGLRGEEQDPVAYQAGGFSESEHRRLAALAHRLDRRGVHFMLSNADCELTRDLFGGFRIDTLSVRRRVGGHAARRGSAQEIVVRNYDGTREVPSLLGQQGEPPPT